MLIEHVSFNAAIMQQLHSLLKSHALGLDNSVLFLKNRDAILEPLLGIDAIVAMEGVIAEIRQHHGRYRRHDKDAGISCFMLAGPHR